MELVFDTAGTLLQIYSYALIIYVLMGWFGGARQTGIGQLLARICEPYLQPFRRIIPSMGMLDISPIVAFIILNYAGTGLRQIYSWIA
ncbi:YggT family protein [Peribacillus sp. SCS-37]|uniref:YggT family protein n=1 Tax=Paraperibacillus esterisolvens TaxID=3115296 RepID=UPI00390675BB